MKRTNDLVEQYYLGKPERIAEKILFIKIFENGLAGKIQPSTSPAVLADPMY